MHCTWRSSLAGLALLALIMTANPALCAATASSSQLHGLLVGVDGRPAGGHAVHLIDDRGRDVARVEVTDEGGYAFERVPAGAYSLTIENPDGLMAPVAARPVRLAERQLVRRDVKLMQASDQQRSQIVGGNYGVGIWWAGLTGAAKVWTVIGIVAIIGISAAAISDDDDPASAF